VSGPGALAGLLLGVGLWLVVRRSPRFRPINLDDRLAPYLAGRSRASPRPWGGLLGTPAIDGTARWLEAVSSSAGVRRRLDQLDRDTGVEQFRAEQLACGLAGVVAGAALASASLVRSGFSPVPVVGLVLVGGLLGVLGRDQWLTRQVRRREERVLAEFPTVAELLALAVGAGEGPEAALDRVARTCRGELSADLRRTLADARTGTSLADALTGMAARTSLPSLARFADGVAVAVERGTPLADVLRAQAQDARTQSRRRLMESGGRREIGMMVPVVFGVLPVTVLFAVYPGLTVLNLF
jgi:tight adherence protein C